MPLTPVSWDRAASPMPIATVPVGQAPADHCPKGRPQGETGGDDRLLEGAEPQSSLGRPLGEEGKCAGDDAGVVPEEQTTEGRDGADGEQALVDPSAIRGHDRGAHGDTSSDAAMETVRMNSSRAASDTAVEPSSPSPEEKASIATVPRYPTAARALATAR